MSTRYGRGSIFEQYTTESPIATELRRLYQNLKQMGDNKKSRSFLITSSKRQEGKSTITACLAITAAEFPKRKVLVVDADLRRPTIHHLFGLSLDNGLSECLQHALINEPEMLLCDEPTGNLDSVSGEAVAKLLENIHRELGTSIVLVTHDESLARLAHETIVLRDGRLVADQTRRRHSRQRKGV